MTLELKPCPFCGGSDLMLGWVEGWRSVRCPSCHAMIEQETDDPKAAWNRRTPELTEALKGEGVNHILYDEPEWLTEALARLKALEECCREYADRDEWKGRIDEAHGEFEADEWAKEIAAIRKAMGASDAEPTPGQSP